MSQLPFLDLSIYKLVFDYLMKGKSLLYIQLSNKHDGRLVSCVSFDDLPVVFVLPSSWQYWLLL